MAFLLEKNIRVGLQAHNKQEAIAELVELLFENGYVRDKQILIQELLEREASGSTGIGHSIAVPHARSNTISEQVAVLGISKPGLDFHALDHQLVHLVFLEVCPAQDASLHLKYMSRISLYLRDAATRRRLQAAETPQAVMQIIRQVEKKTVF